MINISNSKHLDIILPNTNKALAQVLKSATPKELAKIVQGKDLKSVLNTLLQKSATNPSADKELLQLVKNNPTLKNLGEVSSTIKDLLRAVNSEKPTSNLKASSTQTILNATKQDIKSPLNELKSTLQTLTKTLNPNEFPSNRVIVKQVQQLLNAEVLKSSSNSVLEKPSPTVLKDVASNVQTLLNAIKTTAKGADSIHSGVIEKALQKLQHQIEPKNLNIENFKLPAIKEPIEQISQVMQKSFTMESKGILNLIDKILSSLKTVELNATTPKASLEQFTSKNIPQDIARLADSIKTAIQKTDPVFKHETTLLTNKLETLNTPQKLQPFNGVKELIANDIKAVLLQAADEVKALNHPNQTEILKHMDKLSLQIDHYQLLSHLSNHSSLYLPFSWNMLEDGNIEMRKDDEDKFYCDIDLKLKEYGELNVKMVMYDKNQLNIHIYSSHDEFKTIMKENIPSLRSALIETQITPREIRIFEPKKQIASSPYAPQNDDLDMGFEVKA